MSPETPDLQRCLDRLRDGLSAREELIRCVSARLETTARTLFHRSFARLRRWEETGDVLQNVLLRLTQCLQHDPPANLTEKWCEFMRCVEPHDHPFDVVGCYHLLESTFGGGSVFAAWASVNTPR